MAEIKTILCLGAGLMGNGIGQVALQAGYNVIMVDINDEFVDKGVAAIEKGIGILESKGKLGEGVTAAGLLSKLSKSTDLASAVKNADIVIEAVVENMNVKKEVFKTTMDNGPAHVIFA